MTPELTDTEIAEAKAALRAEFPEWSIIYTTDTRRWWANRGPLVREYLDERSSVDADTPDGLRRKINEPVSPQRQTR
ncbi:hypothetical protein [Actinomadura litoris]|uniref:hypothetical protein n=1 Tax=Actinomadura litoris TaxID=2678616 RepID=UPI001FA6C871|nr:hypothetical protein [Actinomadura litoris]